MLRKIKLKLKIMTTQEEIKYQEALKRVKKIKGFYSHAAVYVLVNILIVFLNVRDLAEGESYFQFKNFLTAFFLPNFFRKTGLNRMFSNHEKPIRFPRKRLI